MDKAFLLSRVPEPERRSLRAMRVVGRWEIGAVSEGALEYYLNRVRDLTIAAITEPVKLVEPRRLIERLAEPLGASSGAERAAIQAQLRMMIVEGQLRQIASITRWHRPCAAVYCADRDELVQSALNEARRCVLRLGVLGPDVLKSRLPPLVSSDEDTLSLLLGHLVVLGWADTVSRAGEPIACSFPATQ